MMMNVDKHVGHMRSGQRGVMNYTRTFQDTPMVFSFIPSLFTVRSTLRCTDIIHHTPLPTIYVHRNVFISIITPFAAFQTRAF